MALTRRFLSASSRRIVSVKGWSHRMREAWQYKRKDIGYDGVPYQEFNTPGDTIGYPYENTPHDTPEDPPENISEITQDVDPVPPPPRPPFDAELFSALAEFYRVHGPPGVEGHDLVIAPRAICARVYKFFECSHPAGSLEIKKCRGVCGRDSCGLTELVRYIPGQCGACYSPL